MADNANVQALKAAYKLWNDSKGKSVDHWHDLFDDNLDFCTLGEPAPELEFAARRRSKADLADSLSQLTRDWDMVSYQIDEYIADGDRVAAVGKCAWTNRTTGKTVKTPKADIWHFKDGKAIFFMEFFDTYAAVQGTVA